MTTLPIHAMQAGVFALWAGLDDRTSLPLWVQSSNDLGLVCVPFGTNLFEGVMGTHHLLEGANPTCPGCRALVDLARALSVERRAAQSAEERRREDEEIRAFHWKEMRESDERREAYFKQRREGRIRSG